MQRNREESLKFHYGYSYPTLGAGLISLVFGLAGGMRGNNSELFASLPLDMASIVDGSILFAIALGFFLMYPKALLGDSASKTLYTVFLGFQKKRIAAFEEISELNVTEKGLLATLRGGQEELLIQSPDRIKLHQAEKELRTLLGLTQEKAATVVDGMWWSSGKPTELPVPVSDKEGQELFRVPILEGRRKNRLLRRHRTVGKKQVGNVTEFTYMTTSQVGRDVASKTRWSLGFGISTISALGVMGYHSSNFPSSFLSNPLLWLFTGLAIWCGLKSGAKDGLQLVTLSIDDKQILIVLFGHSEVFEHRDITRIFSGNQEDSGSPYENGDYLCFEVDGHHQKLGGMGRGVGKLLESLLLDSRVQA